MKTRKTQPYKNKYYMRYRSGGYNGAVPGNPTVSGADVLCNCVGYANGRFNEIINDSELKGIAKPFKYQLVCNAENFIESAKNQGLKISSKPVQGGIMVWQKGATLNGYDGAGHVEVVEEVYSDGSILCSSSGWSGWAFRTMRRTNANGRWGQASGYKFRGCIINPAVNGKVVPTPPLSVDGDGGSATVRAFQKFLGTVQDGEISGQSKSNQKFHAGMTAVTYGGGGSLCVKAAQKWAGATQDGYWGKGTSKAIQRKLKSLGYNPGEIDGYFGSKSVKALQKFLNSKPKKKDSSVSTTPSVSKTTKVIDVSEFQDPIDWKKVKADGVVGVIVRCGYRGAEKGTLKEDPMFLNHIKGADKAGLKTGIYMFTEGINAKEGKEEAAYAIKQLLKSGVAIDYPIAVDTETVHIKNERARNLTRAQRTEVIKAFCEEIRRQGYEPMIYASTSWLNEKLDMSKLPYKVWCAQYNTKCYYKGKYVMWQYSSEGKVNGVKGNVDMNECYL